MNSIYSYKMIGSDMSMNQLKNGQYYNLTADMNYSIRTTGHFYISIFTNAAGTVFANDNRGLPIENRKISNTWYIYEHKDKNGATVPGTLTIHFSDGSVFKNDDMHETEYWYTVIGITPVTIKQLT